MIPNTYLRAVLDIWSERGEETACRIAGNCMAPMIREGDFLTIEHGIQHIHVGDVVVFGNPGNIFVNRVVHVEYKNGGESYILKGDQSWAFHQPISRNQILGKVIEVTGSNGHLCLNSNFWKAMNYLLSIRSYISGRHLMADLPSWKAVHYLFVLRSKMLPQWFFIHRVLWNGICLVYRIWSLIEMKGGAHP
jgi:signal peptidase I